MAERDLGLLRLEDEHRQVKTRARAAEAEYRASCQNYLARTEEIRRLERELASAQDSLGASQAVMLQADEKNKALKVEALAAEVRLEDRKLAAQKLAREQQLRTDEKARQLAQRQAESHKLQQRQSQQRAEAEKKAREACEEIVRQGRLRREQLREEAAERARARMKEAEEQHTREDKRRCDERARTKSHPNFTNLNFTEKVPPTPTPPSTPARRWYDRVERAFADYALMETFPDPPAPLTPCKKLTCAASKPHRALSACPCEIERLITSLQQPLKKLRQTFHPDRFWKCKDEHRKVFQMKAKEVFHVVDAMFTKEKDKGAI